MSEKVIVSWTQEGEKNSQIDGEHVRHHRLRIDGEALGPAIDTRAVAFAALCAPLQEKINDLLDARGASFVYHSEEITTQERFEELIEEAEQRGVDMVLDDPSVYDLHDGSRCEEDFDRGREVGEESEREYILSQPEDHELVRMDEIEAYVLDHAEDFKGLADRLERLTL